MKEGSSGVLHLSEGRLKGFMENLTRERSSIRKGIQKSHKPLKPSLILPCVNSDSETADAIIYTFDEPQCPLKTRS